MGKLFKNRAYQVFISCEDGTQTVGSRRFGHHINARRVYPPIPWDNRRSDNEMAFIVRIKRNSPGVIPQLVREDILL